MCKVVFKDRSWNSQAVLSEHDPTIITFSHTCNNEGNGDLYIQPVLSVAGFVPKAQKMSCLYGKGHSMTTPVDDADKQVRNTIRGVYLTSRVETGGEPTNFDRFRDRIRCQGAT